MRKTLFVLGVLSTTVVAAPMLAVAGGNDFVREALPTQALAKPTAPPPHADGAPPPAPRMPHPHNKGSGYGDMDIGPSGVRPETALAIRLGVLETRIGIRAEQLNAWRDYTDALQRLLAPPQAGPTGQDPAPPARPPVDAFAFEEQLARDAVARTAAAEKLTAAIATLRTTLTPEQQQLMASTELFPGRPPFPGK